MSQVGIRHSDDGGHTWSAQVFYPLGTPADSYLKRVVLHRQGSAFQRIYEIEFSEDDDFTLIEAFGDVSAGID